MFILEAGIFFMALGLALTAFGYNLKLPGYSRRKMLEGQSVHTQMLIRRDRGISLIQIGVITMAVTAFIVFVVLGLILEVKTVTIDPKKVDVMLAQNKTVVIADGDVYGFGRPHYHIRKIYIKQGFNSYGMQCSDNKLIIEDQDQWEVLGR